MFDKIKAWWAECGRKSELRLIRKHYSRKTGVSIDHHSDEEIEEFINIGYILRKHKLSADDVIKYLTTIVEMDKERGETLKPCPKCKKPRGEEENGAYICPCPHCNDECPF